MFYKIKNIPNDKEDSDLSDDEDYQDDYIICSLLHYDENYKKVSDTSWTKGTNGVDFTKQVPLGEYEIIIKERGLIMAKKTSSVKVGAAWNKFSENGKQYIPIKFEEASLPLTITSDKSLMLWEIPQEELYQRRPEIL